MLGVAIFATPCPPRGLAGHVKSNPSSRPGSSPWAARRVAGCCRRCFCCGSTARRALSRSSGGTGLADLGNALDYPFLALALRICPASRGAVVTALLRCPRPWPLLVLHRQRALQGSGSSRCWQRPAGGGRSWLLRGGRRSSWRRRTSTRWSRGGAASVGCIHGAFTPRWGRAGDLLGAGVMALPVSLPMATLFGPAIPPAAGGVCPRPIGWLFAWYPRVLGAVGSASCRLVGRLGGALAGEPDRTLAFSFPVAAADAAGQENRHEPPGGQCSTAVVATVVAPAFRFFPMTL